MPGERTWCAALCLLAVRLHDAGAAGAPGQAAAAAGGHRFARRPRDGGLALLQLEQSHSAVHSHGVTPEFFEDAGAAAHSFDPVASGSRTVAAQAGPAERAMAAAAVRQSAGLPAAAAVAKQRGAQPSTELMHTEERASSSMLPSLGLGEMATVAGQVLSLVKEGARAAAKNAAPSWFSGDVAAASGSAAALPVPVDAGSGVARVPVQLASTPQPAGAGAGGAGASADAPAPGGGLPAELGAMAFFGVARRRPEGWAPPAEARPPAALLLATAAARPKAPAAPHVEHDEDAMEVLPAPRLTQAELQARERQAEEMRRAEAREAQELAQQAELEESMESARWENRR